MERKILIWLIMVLALLAALGYLLSGNNNTTTTTSTLGEATTTTTSLKTTTTTRAIGRTTYPTTTQKEATTLETTTTSPYDTSTTTSTTTQPGTPTTQSTTTIPTTTVPGATTNPTTTTTIAGATTTQAGATTNPTTATTAATTTPTTAATTTNPTTATTRATTTTPTTTATTAPTTTPTTTATTNPTSATTRATTTTPTTTATTAPTTPTTQPPLSGPVVHFRFDESAGSTAYDSSVGGNDASLVNGATWTSGRTGNALRLDGANDYVDAGNPSSLDITGAVTIMAWINPSIAQEVCYPAVGENRGIAGKVDAATGSSSWSWQLRFGSPTNCALGFQFNDPVNGRRWVSVGQALTPGQWYHVAAVFDGSTARSYLNGVQKESVMMSSIQSYPTTKLIIGSDGWGDYFSGSIDDFRVYKKALSAAEINQIISAAGTTTTTKSTTTTTSSTTRTTTTSTTTRTTTSSTTTRTTTTTTRTTTTTTTTTVPSIPGNAVYVADFGVAYGETAGDQTAKVNSAISAAVSQGKTLVFPANQVIALDGTLDFKSLTVIGNGCRLFLMPGHDGGSGGGGWQWMKLGVGGKMSGMIIDGNRAHQGDGIFGNVHGIRLMGDNVFEYNTVKRVTSYGVVLYAGSPPTNVYIRNNVFDDIGQYGVTTGCTDGDYCYGHNVVVTDNTFRECHEVGVKIRGTVGATIARNTITVGSRLPGRDTPSGIRLYSWDDPNWDIVIQDNTVTGLDGADTVCIDSDDSQNYRITITGNTISHCDTGIELQFTGGTITNNRISNCNSCITGTSGNTVTNNICA